MAMTSSPGWIPHVVVGTTRGSASFVDGHEARFQVGRGGHIGRRPRVSAPGGRVSIADGRTPEARSYGLTPMTTASCSPDTDREDTARSGRPDRDCALLGPSQNLQLERSLCAEPIEGIEQVVDALHLLACCLQA